jgi:uncharacterized protein YkwD
MTANGPCRRAILALGALALMGAGAAFVAPAPLVMASAGPLYADLARPEARLDLNQARAVISAYRLNNGLAALRLDPRLQAAAEREAAQMARADRPASAEAVKRRVAGEGIAGVEANLSAGYRSLAQAFSGWRDSPPHQRVMLTRGATRMGIAAAPAPGSKYGVYWALIVAGD